MVSKNNDPATLDRPHCEEFLERHVGLAVDFFCKYNSAASAIVFRKQQMPQRLNKTRCSKFLSSQINRWIL